MALHSGSGSQSADSYTSDSTTTDEVDIANAVTSPGYESLRINNLHRGAFSMDVAHAEKFNDNPVISNGVSGEWDDQFIAMSEAVSFSDTLLVFYGGRPDGSTFWRPGLAISYDGGKTFHKHADNPLLGFGSAGDFDESSRFPYGLLWDDETAKWKMYYHGRDPDSNIKLGVANSDDLINWTVSSNNPILSASDFGLSTDLISNPNVIKYNGYVYLVTVYDTLDSIVMARSEDGETGWEMHPENPIIEQGAAGEFDDNRVQDPSIRVAGSKFFITYGAGDGSNYSFGLASADHPWETWSKDRKLLDADTVSLRNSPVFHEGRWLFFYDDPLIEWASIGFDESIKGVPQTRVELRLTSDQTGISSAANEVVQWDTASTDRRGEFNGTDGVVVGQPGDYRVYFSPTWTPIGADTKFETHILLDGSKEKIHHDIAPTNDYYSPATYYELDGLSRGDKIGFAVRQESGSNQDLFGDANGFSTWARISRMQKY